MISNATGLSSSIRAVTLEDEPLPHLQTGTKMQIRTQIFPVNARIWPPFQGYGVTGVVTIFGVSPRLGS